MTTRNLYLIIFFLSVQFTYANCHSNASISNQPTNQEVCLGAPEGTSPGVLTYQIPNYGPSYRYIYRIYRNGNLIHTSAATLVTIFNYSLPNTPENVNNMDNFYCTVEMYINGCVYDESYTIPYTTSNTITVSYVDALDLVSYVRNSPKTLNYCDASDNVQVDFTHDADAFLWKIKDENGNLLDSLADNVQAVISTENLYELSLRTPCGTFIVDTVYGKLNDACDIGASFRFDGTNNSKITTSNLNLDTHTSYTYETWIRLASDNQSDYAGVALFRLPNVSGIILRRQGPNNNRRIHLSALEDFEFIGPELTVGQWHHIVLVRSNDSLMLYKDGQGTLVYNSAKNPMSFNLALNLGGDIAGREMDGDMDDFRFWTRALSADEIEANYLQKCPVDAQSDGLKIYYDFNQGAHGADNSSITYLENLVDLTDQRAGFNNLPRTGLTRNFTRNTPLNTSVRIKQPIVSMDAAMNLLRVNNPQDGVNYQWFGSCSSTPNLFGSQTDSVFVFEYSGHYNVEASAGACALKSTCEFYRARAEMIEFSLSDSAFCGSGGDITASAEFDVSAINFPYVVILYAELANGTRLSLNNFGQQSMVSHTFSIASGGEGFVVDYNQAKIYFELVNFALDRRLFSPMTILNVTPNAPAIQTNALSVNRETICPNDNPADLIFNLDESLIQGANLIQLHFVDAQDQVSTISSTFPYTIINADETKVGRYFLEVSNACGAVYSDTVAIGLSCNEGRSFNFNSTFGNVNVNLEEPYQGNQFTFECWIRPDFTNPNFNANYTGIFITRPAHVGLVVRRDGQNNLRLGSMEHWATNEIGQALIPGEWQHVALVYNNGISILYLNGDNGVQFPSSSTSLNLTNSFFIGNDNAAQARNFVGDIDEVKFWTKALSQTEILAIKNQKCPSNPNEEGLEMYFDFNFGEGGGDNSAITSMPNLANNSSLVASFNNLNRVGGGNNFMPSSPFAISFNQPTITANSLQDEVSVSVQPSYLNYTYQWFNCPNFDDIVGADGTTLSIQETDHVGVNVTYDGCTLPSKCFDPSTVSTLEISNDQSPLFYPNPSQNWIYTSELVSIYTIEGKLLLRDKNHIDISHLSPGMYIVKGDSQSGKLIIK